jgi:hypothetical protein
MEKIQREKIISRLKKMMALAQDQAGRPEGELAAKKAHALMMQHAIEMVDLGSDEPQEEIDTLKMKIGHSNWKRSLLNVIAKYCNCSMYFHSATPTGCIVGFPAEAEVAKYLYEVVCKEIERHCKSWLKIYCKDKPWLERGDKRKLGTSFKRSAVQGVREKVQSIEDASKVSNEVGTALMVNRKQQVNQWVAENLNLQSARSTYQSSFNEAGHRCGKNVSLSQGIGSRSNTSIGE